MQEEEKENQEELDQEELAKQWEEALAQQQQQEGGEESEESQEQSQEELAKQWEEALKEQQGTAQVEEEKKEETPPAAAATSPESNLSKLLERIMDIPLTVEVVVGSTTMILKDLLNIGPGSVIELDREINEPVDIRVNGKLMAQGELVVIGEKFGVRITEIYKEEKRNIFKETLQERMRK